MSIDIISVYAGLYPATADDVMDMAGVYDAAAVRETIERVQRAAEKDAARPDNDRPDISDPERFPKLALWRRKKTPEEWAERLHDRLCDIVRRGYASQYAPAACDALCDLVTRGASVCYDGDGPDLLDIGVMICPGCSITLEDLRLLNREIHGVGADAADTSAADIRRTIESGDFRALLDMLDLTQTECARRFGIPLRTVQNWAAGTNTPPAYIPRMMAECMGLIGPLRPPADK